MSGKLRPFSEEDYPRYVEINNRVHPDYPASIEEVRHHDSTWDSSRYDRLRLVAESDAGDIVGYGEIHHIPYQFHPRKYGMNLVVDPAFQRRGFGSLLYDRLLAELHGREAILVRTDVRASMTESVAFVTQRGFVEVLREWESRLDVEAFDFAPFSGAEARPAAEGITITTLAAERQRDPEALEKLHELHNTCEQDVPAVDPVTAIPFELFLAQSVDAPNALEDAHFIARDGDDYVGVSNLFRSLEDPGVLYQGLTGVRREYRGRGLAMALKLQTVRYAREHGYREIRTWNDTRNRPMLRINEAMGFQKQPVWIEFEKRLV